MAQQTFKRLDPFIISTIRKAVTDWPELGAWRVSGPESCVEEEIASGRSRCRDCGELITKGDRVLRFTYSFDGRTYTSSVCYLHPHDCAPDRMARRLVTPQ